MAAGGVFALVETVLAVAEAVVGIARDVAAASRESAVNRLSAARLVIRDLRKKPADGGK